jgi:hypothetical protein
MIMAGSFVKSQRYRDIEMLTTERVIDGEGRVSAGLLDWPLAVQFASSRLRKTGEPTGSSNEK